MKGPFTGRVFSILGIEKGTFVGATVDAVKRLIDDSKLTGEATVRSDWTSDGSHWPGGKGKVVASRDSGGKWHRE